MSVCGQCGMEKPEGVTLSRCPRCSTRWIDPPEAAPGASGSGSANTPGAGAPPAAPTQVIRDIDLSALPLPETEPVISPRSPKTGAGSADRSKRQSCTFSQTPGSIVAGRFELLAPLGHGGMGEVYKAEDRTLQQIVALKFFSAESSKDPEHLAQLLNEVRVARRVTHPNVCRVHDIEEWEGRRFIAMEYVDGEDLGTLLKRVGRLADDRALALARQLCAGLASAHAQGVLHRDFKPSNIMIDAQGHVKITDFGLAGFAEDIRHSRARAGTPAYMAPEQLTGTAASERTDIYSLGLTLYELFTGRAVYRARDMDELYALHEKEIEPPSRIVPSLDPSIERTIMQCLARRPEERPPSVLLAASALLNEDPLAMAREAGVTPSPQLVAAAGSQGLLKPAEAAGLVLGLLLLLGTVVALAPKTMLLSNVPLNLSRDVLADRSRELLRTLGYGTPLRHEAYDFDYYDQLVRLIERADESPGRWARLRRVRPAAVDFWYRASPLPMLTQSDTQRVGMRDPPLDVAGMAAVRLDPAGGLRELVIVPEIMDFEAIARGEAPLNSEAPEADWSPLLAAAHLNPAALQPAAPRRNPSVYADRRRAWSGAYPDNPTEHILVEAASLQGKPVAFRIIETRWATASAYDAGAPPKIDFRAFFLKLTTNVLSLVGAVALAWLNIRRKRGDRPGAIRLAAGVSLVGLGAAMLTADHVLALEGEVVIVTRALHSAFLMGGLAWVLYIAIEPYVRREWPETLIAWSRLLSGRWRDPLVGQRVLLGVLGGTLAMVLRQFDQMSPAWLRLAPGPYLAHETHVPEGLAGGRFIVGLFGEAGVDSLLFAMFVLLAFVILKLVTGSRTSAAVLFVVIAAAMWRYAEGHSMLSWVFEGLLAGAVALTLVRCGLLTLVVGTLSYLMLLLFPLALDASKWFLPTTLATLGALVGFGALAAAVAMGWFRPRVAMA